jgi:hypothetical protein
VTVHLQQYQAGHLLLLLVHLHLLLLLLLLLLAVAGQEGGQTGPLGLLVNHRLHLGLLLHQEQEGPDLGLLPLPPAVVRS